MIPTKVKVKFEFKHPFANEVLPVGFETELVPVYSTEDKLIFPEQTKHVNGKVTVIIPAVIRPAGSYEGCDFKGANGETYGDYWIYLLVGYKPFSEIFDKIN